MWVKFIGQLRLAMPAFFAWLRVTGLVYLQKEATKLLLKKLLGSAALAGPKAWLIKFVVSNFLDEIAKPIAQAVVVELQYSWNVVEGKVLITRLDKAKEDGNEDAYNGTIDDILG